MHHRRITGFSTIVFLLLTPIVAFAAVNTLTRPSFSEAPVYFQTTQTYIVKPGDTLWGLSKKLGVSVSDLAAWNDVTNPHFLQPGQPLKYESILSDAQVYAKDMQSDGQPASPPPHQAAEMLSGRSGGTPVRVLMSGHVIHCVLTAYTAGPESTGKQPGDPGYDITSTGQRAIQGITVAVDPSVIPYGTKLFIPGVGFRIAEDTGSAIVGQHIDVFFNDLNVARQFGVHPDVPVYILPNWFPMPNFQA